MWLGVLVGVVAAPAIGAVLRPIVKGTLKGAFALTEEVREDLEDVRAEAKAERLARVRAEAAAARRADAEETHDRARSGKASVTP